MFKIISQADSSFYLMLFKTKVRCNCSQQVPQRCITIDPAIILQKNASFHAKKQFTGNTISKISRKKLGEHQANKKFTTMKKSPLLKQLFLWPSLCLSFCLAVILLVKKTYYLEYRFPCPLLILTAYSGNTFSKRKNFENK